MENKNSSLDIVKQHFENLDNYFNSDERLKNNRSLLEPKLSSNIFDKFVNMAAGVREIHKIDYKGSILYMRLLSISEERTIKIETIREFKKYPEFIGAENHPEFERILMIKIISRATTACPEEFNLPSGSRPIITEQELESFPHVVLSYLYNQYIKLNNEYNLEFDLKFEEEVTDFLAHIFDGAPINQKKLTLLDGLTSVQKSTIIVRLCNVLTRLEDNQQFITLLSGLNQNEELENKENMSEDLPNNIG